MTRSRYRKIRKLASGGMGDVFLARQEAEGGVRRLIALKRIRSDLSSQSSFVELFRNEARVAALMSHPNIVQVYDFGAAAGSLFLAMEYVAGCSLHELMLRASRAGRTIPFDVIASIAIDIARALRYAHDLEDEDGTALGIVHRDLTPGNVIISLDGTSKVLDFGIAKASIAKDSTETEAIKGKLHYLSPEQARLEPVDRRSDIFSFGITLWEMTTGQNLFHVPSKQVAAEYFSNAVVPSVTLHRDDVIPGWAGVLSRALALNPDDRYQRAQEMQDDLERMARMADLRVSNLSVVRLIAELFPELALASLPRAQPTPDLPRLLAVDDETHALEFIQRALRKMFRVTTATCVAEAREELARSAFDVVMTDERMPVERGIVLLKYVAAKSPRTKRVMMTGFADSEIMLAAINEGSVDRFICKPIKTAELKSLLTELTANRRREVQPTGEVFEHDHLTDRLTTVVDQATAAKKAAPSRHPDLEHAPPIAIPWESLASFSRDLSSADTADTADTTFTLFLGICVFAINEDTSATLADLVIDQPPGGWVHVEGHQAILMLRTLPPSSERAIAERVRDVLAASQPNSRSAVALLRSASAKTLAKNGKDLEDRARRAWNKEPDYVID